MPCLNLSTNVSLDGIDTSSILSEATSAVAKIIGKPEAVTSLSSFLFASFFLSHASLVFNLRFLIFLFFYRLFGCFQKAVGNGV